MRQLWHTPFQTSVVAFALWLVVPAEAPAQGPPDAIDPCALLSRDEVSAAMGQMVEAGRLTNNGLTPDGAFSTTCLWAVALPPGVAPDPTKSLGGRSFAILNVMNWAGGPNDARKFLESFRKAFAEQAINSKPVTVEIGADEALWWGDGVAARKDNVSFGISVATAGDRSARQPKAERLARLIIRRLARTPA
jgi:hypothetical protein